MVTEIFKTYDQFCQIFVTLNNPLPETNSMVIRSFCIAILLLFVFSPAGTAQSNKNINIKLQLKWWHQFQFAGYYAAITQGYYAKAGLNVTLIPGDAKHIAVDEVLSGHANFGVTGSDLLIEYSKGKPLMALGAIFQHSPYVIISSAASHINVPSDLVGKTIMASENQGWVELKAIFLKEGIDIKNISVKSHSWNNMDLVEGRIDALTGYRSVEPFQLQQLGMKPSFILPINYGVDFYGDVLFSTRPYAQQNQQLVENFRQASFRGWEYAMDHKEELCNYILKVPGVAERKVTKAALMYEADEMEKLILPQLVEMGHMNEGRWSHILTIHQTLGLIPSSTRLDNFLYEKKPSLSESLKNIGAVVLAGVVLLFLIVVMYGIMVRKAVKRKTKEQREALEALSISNRELKQFSYITSHNLRGPVTNLIALTELIDSTKIPDEETRQLIQGFTTSTRQLNETLDDLIRILIIKENTTQPDEVISFEEVLHQVMNAIHFIIEKEGAVIRTDFSACGKISYNRSFMESIFMNLLTNSIKYAYPGRVPEIDIYTEITDDQLQLIFKDNGRGFDTAKIKDRLFGLHQRFHNHPNSKGVGLYLIHSQITSLGGTIEAHSEVGVGTTFIVRF